MARVMVLEDEVDVRDLLVLHLKREGYEVVAYESADHALEGFPEETSIFSSSIGCSRKCRDLMCANESAPNTARMCP